MPKATKRERQRQNREARRQAMLEAERRRKQFRFARNLLVPLAIVAAVLVIVQVTGDDEAGTPTTTTSAIDRTFDAAPEVTIDPAATYTAAVSTNKGDFSIRIDAAKYPIAANNFVFLAQNKFYDGLEVVRVVKDFVFQAGSPSNTQQGGPGYTTQAEVPTRTAGTLLYPKGTIAMAKTDAEPAGTIGSQFFIVTSDDADTALGTSYAIVGQVTSGLDVIDAIGKLFPSSNDGPPTAKVRITSIIVTKA